jgi:hypothetical protein
MTRVGVIGGHCQLIEALQGTVERANRRGKCSPGASELLARLTNPELGAPWPASEHIRPLPKKKKWRAF